MISVVILAELLVEYTAALAKLTAGILPRRQGDRDVVRIGEWMRRSEEKHQHVLCPQCRTAVQYVGKNHFLKNIQEDILKVDAALRRPAEDIAVLDSSEE